MRKHHNRLFYGRYTHKAVFDMPWASYLYPTTDEHLSDIVQSPQPEMMRYFNGSDFKKMNATVLPKARALAYIIRKYRNQMKFRIQQRETIIYSNKKLVSEIVTSFWDEWKNSFETKNDYMAKMDKNTVLCSRLPHKKYQYQVWMKQGCYTSDDKMAKSLSAYMLGKPDVGIPANKLQQHWLEGKSDYDGSGYMYVSDEKCLTPVHLILGENIDKIVKFVKI